MASRVTKTATAVAENMYELGSGSTYTKVGSLTDNRGVFSGFSASNYITTNCSMGANSNNLVVAGSYITSNITSEQYIICTLSRNFAIKVQNSKFIIQISSNNGSNWNVVQNGSKTITANTKYYFKAISDNSKIYLYIDNVLDATLTIPTDGTFASTTMGFGNHIPTKAVPALGFIDIKDFEVNISGKTVWNGLDAYMLNNKAKIGKYFIGASEFCEV